MTAWGFSLFNHKRTGRVQGALGKVHEPWGFSFHPQMNRAVPGNQNPSFRPYAAVEGHAVVLPESMQGDSEG
jgi:hypothetical protein